MEGTLDGNKAEDKQILGNADLQKSLGLGQGFNQAPCPNCGYCPCCGRPRGNYPQYPIYPMYPTLPLYQDYC